MTDNIHSEEVFHIYGTYTYLSTTSDKLQGNIIVCCADGNSAPTPTPTPTPTTTLTDPDTPEYIYWKAENLVLKILLNLIQEVL